MFAGKRGEEVVPLAGFRSFKDISVEFAAFNQTITTSKVLQIHTKSCHHYRFSIHIEEMGLS